MMRRILPHPFLTLLLALIWCLLTNTFSIGNIVFGLILGFLLPILTSPYWPNPPKSVKFGRLFAYIALVLWDILVANVEVAWIILTKNNADMRTRWVVLPLEIRTPEAITMLAGTITLTPGTVSADLSDRGHSLLIHALDTGDVDETAQRIKYRYERRLKEIFE